MGWKRILSQKRPLQAEKLANFFLTENCSQQSGIVNRMQTFTGFGRFVRIKQKASEYENEERRVCSKQFGRQE